MLSTIEKVIQLRTVEMLAETPDAILAQVASALEEVEASEGDEIVVKDQLSSKMYLVVAGRLAVSDGGNMLTQIGARDVFGELAALNPEPQPSSLTALDHSLMLSLDHTSLMELMTEHIDMTAGIVRFLCKRVQAHDR